MKLNLKGWHKISSDKTHTTMRDPKGHELKVYHKALSRELRNSLDKLPVQMAEGGMVQSLAMGGEVKRYADGGPVAPEQDTPEAIQAAAAQVDPDQRKLQERYNIDVAAKHMADPADPMAMDMMIGGGKDPVRIDPVSLQKAQLSIQDDKLREAEKQQAGIKDTAEQDALRAQAGLPPLSVPPVLSPMAVAPPGAPMPSATAQAEPQAPTPQAPMQAAPQGAEALQQATQAQYKAIDEQAARDVQAIERSQRYMADAEANFKNQISSLDAQREKIQKDLDDDVINPSRFFDNMSVGQKIASAIGLMLGGMGSGLLHQENPALAMLNKAVDSDINAQKANIGKKENLLAMNLRQYGNVKDAEAASRIMINDKVMSDLKKSAALAQGPQAKALLAQEMAKMQMAQDQAKMRFGLERGVRETVNKDLNSFSTIVDQMRSFDPKRAAELEEQFVPGVGLAMTGNDAKELKELKGTVDTAKDGLMRLRSMTFIPGRSASPELRAEAEVIAGTLQGLLRVPITGPGAMSDSEREMMKALVADPTAILSLDGPTRMRLSTLAGRLDKSLAMKAKAAGIPNYDPANSLPPQNKVMADWARANRQDPRSKQVLDKLGLE